MLRRLKRKWVLWIGPAKWRCPECRLLCRWHAYDLHPELCDVSKVRDCCARIFPAVAYGPNGFNR